MTVSRLLLLLILLPLPARAADAWIFLKDGRVCLGDAASGQGKLPDDSAVTFTREEIQSQRTVSDVAQSVDAMLTDIDAGRNVEVHATRFRALKGAAVPRLLEQLATNARTRKISALYALQFCWAPQAEAPVRRLLSDTDANVFKMAMCAACNHMTVTTMVALLRGRAEDKDLSVASAVFELIEKYRPDATLKRLRRMLGDAKARSSTLPVLSHYFAPDLTPLTLPLLEGTAAEKRTAIVALLEQTADGADVRKRVAALLSSPDADVRETAAEYFEWLGASEDLDAIRAARKTESDLYVKAALDAALAVVAHRDSMRGKLAEGKSSVVMATDTDAHSRETYRAFLKALSTFPNRGDYESARAFYRVADAYEPFTPFAVPYDQDEDGRFRLRSLLAQHLFAAPCGELNEDSIYEFRDERAAPVAGQLVPPIREYFDPQRKSYGFYMDADKGSFANSIHVGDDCGWNKEHRTVVSIAPGVVRLVSHIVTWGHIVVVEHTSADGSKFCSLYGHLSPLILVRPGDVVDAGQKLGSIGRSNSIDNGGYGAHVHFGIHKGPYATETHWICGYVDPQVFKNGEHGWADPQAFLKRK